MKKSNYLLKVQYFKHSRAQLWYKHSARIFWWEELLSVSAARFMTKQVWNEMSEGPQHTIVIALLSPPRSMEFCHPTISKALVNPRIIRLESPIQWQQAPLWKTGKLARGSDWSGVGMYHHRWLKTMRNLQEIWMWFIQSTLLLQMF